MTKTFCISIPDDVYIDYLSDCGPNRSAYVTKLIRLGSEALLGQSRADRRESLVLARQLEALNSDHSELKRKYKALQERITNKGQRKLTEEEIIQKIKHNTAKNQLGDLLQ